MNKKPDVVEKNVEYRVYRLNNDISSDKIVLEPVHKYKTFNSIEEARDDIETSLLACSRLTASEYNIVILPVYSFVKNSI